MTNLVILNRVDFDILLRMSWLFSYDVTFDFHAKIVIVAMPGMDRS